MRYARAVEIREKLMIIEVCEGHLDCDGGACTRSPHTQKCLPIGWRAGELHVVAVRGGECGVEGHGADVLDLGIQRGRRYGPRESDWQGDRGLVRELNKSKLGTPNA